MGSLHDARSTLLLKLSLHLPVYTALPSEEKDAAPCYSKALTSYPMASLKSEEREEENGKQFNKRTAAASAAAVKCYCGSGEGHK